VVAKFDRLFRSVADAAQTIADFDKRGIELVAIAEGFDMAPGGSCARSGRADVHAALVRSRIIARSNSAKTEAICAIALP
jgi:DNA invertase Pin-like site-specific DNA recombinase